MDQRLQPAVVLHAIGERGADDGDVLAGFQFKGGGLLCERGLHDGSGAREAEGEGRYVVVHHRGWRVEAALKGPPSVYPYKPERIEKLESLLLPRRSPSASTHDAYTA